MLTYSSVPYLAHQSPWQRKIAIVQRHSGGVDRRMLDNDVQVIVFLEQFGDIHSQRRFSITCVTDSRAV
jgi:hypothetical protein